MEMQAMWARLLLQYNNHSSEANPVRAPDYQVTMTSSIASDAGPLEHQLLQAG